MSFEVPVPLRMMATLAFAGLVSGAGLAGVYTVTKPQIEINQAEELQEKALEVLDGATRLQPMVEEGGVLVPYAGDRSVPEGEFVYSGFDGDGKAIGYAIPATGKGFQDKIKLIYGLDKTRGRIIGMRVLESLETPGLGDKIIKDPSFVAEWDDLTYEPDILFAKSGQGRLPVEVDGISGATISTKAVIKTVNDSNDRWLGILPDVPPSIATPSPGAP